MNETQTWEPNTKDFLFPPVLRLYVTRWVMTDLERLYNTPINQALSPLFLQFLFYLASVNGRDFWVSLLSLSKKVFTSLVVFPFPLQLPLLCPFSSSYSCCLQKTLTMMPPLFLLQVHVGSAVMSYLLPSWGKLVSWSWHERQNWGCARGSQKYILSYQINAFVTTPNQTPTNQFITVGNGI